MIVKGDITDIDCNYICQQNNCISVYPHSSSLTISNKLGVCPYSNRTSIGTKNLAIESHRPVLGTISIIQSPIKDVKVVCMFAQYSYGKPGSRYYYARNETFEFREKAFAECLRDMNNKISPHAVIAFPKNIGCGLAGGRWEIYMEMIESFAKDRIVKIVDYE